MTSDIEQEFEQYMAMPYEIKLAPDPEDGGWVVSIPDLPYCMSEGDTVEEAMEMIRDAQRGWLTVVLSHGDSVPEPRVESTYSGKFMLRVPQTLHRTLVEEAGRQNVSLNQYAVMLLAKGAAQTSLNAQVEQRLADLQVQVTALQKAVERSRERQVQRV